jgi:type II secretory pathway pseudopilin PulG
MIRSMCGRNLPFPGRLPTTNRSSRAPMRGRNNGYALLALMIFVTVLLISMTAALPRVYQEGQREREEEAIFRAEQYDRAIYLFHRTLGRYPNSVKELLSTNGVRYLRQAYPDPLSPNHRWRFIHATAGGIILDSITQATNNPSNPSGQNTGAPNTNASGANTPSFSGQTGGASSFSSGFSLQSGQTSGFSTGTDEAASGQTSSAAKKPKPSPDCQAPAGAVSSSEPQTGTLLGAEIVGIAPCNDNKSIRVLNKQDEYDKWEFLSTNYGPYKLPTTQVVQPSSSFPNSAPGQAQSPFQSTSQPGMQNTPPQNTNQGP